MSEKILKKRISNDISINGAMPFGQFMQLALYEPQWGYYNNNWPKLGRKGDFVTACEIGTLFASCLAMQIAPLISEKKTSVIMELGPGRGQLALDLLRELEKKQALPDMYFMLEISPYLRAQQESLIKKNIPHIAHRVRWLKSLENVHFEGVVIANEVLDAMPVQRFFYDGKNVFNIAVGVDKEHKLQDELVEANKDLCHFVTKLNLTEPYQSEYNSWVAPWLKALHDVLEKGWVFLIDYGFPCSEYYHADRKNGTLMCHYQHTCHTNPYKHIGEQDITAHVDFTLVAEKAVEAGFQVRAYINQAAFLLANNLLSIATEQIVDDRSQLVVNQEIKVLTMPHEMGELFKVMVLSKNTDMQLTNLVSIDKRHSL